MKGTRKAAIGTAVIGLLAAGAWTILRGAAHIEYRTVALGRGDIESTIAATGSCNAVVTVQVGSQVSGNIKELLADFNSKVVKGQVVAIIDPEIFQARVNQAQANLDNARAAVSNSQAVAQKIRADIMTANASTANMRAEVAKAQVSVRESRLKLDRRKEMGKERLIAAEDIDTAQAAYDAAVAAEQAAEAQFNASLSGVKSTEAQLQVALAQVESNKAQVRQAEAALAQAELDLKHTRILAPVDGTVISRRVDAGQTVAASLQAPTIFEIAQDLTRIQVDTNVDEADIGKVRVGQSATFTVDAYPGKVFQARVQQIREAPINTQNVITYDVVLNVDNAELKLFPGMTANVRILTSTVTDVLEVPNAALRFRPAGESADAPGPSQFSGRSRTPRASLYVLDGKGQPRRVSVIAGITNGSFTEIRGGALKQGDPVIVDMMGSRRAPQNASTQGPGRGPRGPSF